MTDKKLGRNDPCWCGSGRKFKRCHLNRESQKSLTPQEIQEAEREAFGKLKCSAPETWHQFCSDQIVSAHTVQKRGSLRHIARDGRVYGFRTSFLDIFHQKGRLVPRLIGLNRASTFTGFCSRHDDEIFKEIETRPFAATPEQCFLLDYRAICWELFAKEGSAALDGFRRQADRGTPRPRQRQVQQFCSWFQEGVELGLRDLSSYKRRLDGVLLSGDFGSVRGYVIELDHPPPVMCSGAFPPEQDFLGRSQVLLANLQAIPPYLSISSFYGGDSGAVVFAWPDVYDSTNLPFIQSLTGFSGEELTAALLRLFFEKCENTYMAPDWWEGLPDKVREAVIARMTRGGRPDTLSGPDALTDDGVRFPTWSVVRRRCVGFDM